ncbi:acyltransferase family protein [Porphyromonas cangingivalis]|uniref:Fucose 4-O-acetylase n=1 Tax=Porphyromonas cangingivalis TaxID=36874 RepID=A0A1T4K250_PORCN|nr:acyltransferase [Porphyromonas cangingivalis]SJZ36468.1 Fucose 4-O-acetylase [Porphyromonas cangingivalis]VEJ03371.1 Fucose 4-O-acetylase and related acetyltransferases [Porphyromonas cangingivalis]
MDRPSTPYRQRSGEIDYVKSILIILMIIFHLVYIGDKHPYLKAVVYTFHMSGFLLISGFLMNTKKDTKAVLTSLLWLFVPYAIMETGYVVMASMIPIREHIDSLTPLLLVDKIFLHPIGPYWYLHTLIICYVIWYLIDRFAGECLAISVFWVVVALYALSHTDIISVDNALYFMLAALIKRQGLKFDRVFYATVWAIIPLIALCCFPSNLDRGTLGGVTITYLAISFLLSLYPHFPKRAKEISEFVGRNTLPLLLFSPIFTHLSKPLVPVLSFDPTGLLFTAVAVLFTVMGSFAIAWLIDRSGLSRVFWGNREKFSWKGLRPLSQK